MLVMMIVVMEVEAIVRGMVAVWWWHGGDDDSKVNCGDDLDGDSDDSNNGDGVDDDVNINGSDYQSW